MIRKMIFEFYQNAKLKRLLNRLKIIGVNNKISSSTLIFYPERVSLGSYIYIGPNAEINGLGEVEIMNGVIIGPNLVIHSANHNFKNSKYIPYDETFDFRRVIIGENVWVGGNVIITPGSNIGEGCIIGAGCVVSGTIPPLSIVIGNPCKVIKSRDSEHYYRLKNENKIYLKEKLIKNLKPEINLNYNE
ncbi:acyltransferase [Flavobacterium sp. 140616W15]|uniref:acyltransferase n=1 Tax=Flavobacterium sp. 140616W15 TaxID=2478552 RepID=UPI000F0C1E78|nr:acyltransferase [Flavobacterium sp. 140616W15]AYN05210.1 acyltransferase [Flavobacterium sp. 140616W15]